MSASTSSRELALFPLGLVLLPTMLVPLRIFEPRYQSMLADVMEADRRFGVVLLTRGNEVGQVHDDLDSSRSRVGTMARVVRAPVNTEGFSEILITGEERFRVKDWLPDAPYPRAKIEFWPDEVVSSQSKPEAPSVEVAALLAAARSELDALGAVLERAGHSVGPLPENDDDPVTGSFQLAAAAPFEAYDQQRLLVAPTSEDRLILLRSLIEDLRTLVLMQLDSGS